MLDLNPRSVFVVTNLVIALMNVPNANKPIWSMRFMMKNMLQRKFHMRRKLLLSLMKGRQYLA